MGRVAQKLEQNVGLKVGQNSRTKESNKKSDRKYNKKSDKYIGKSLDKKSDQKSDKKSDKLIYSYFEKVHATIPKGIVSGFGFTVVQRNLKEWHERPWTHVYNC